MDQPAFLITYKRLDVTELEAENIIGDGYSVVDAVAALSGGKKMKEGTIYHFNGMGTSALIPRPEWMERFAKYLTQSSGDILSFIRVGITISPEQRAASHPDVLSVCYCRHGAEPTKWSASSSDARFSSEPPDRTEWNLTRIDADGSFARRFSGKGIKIAILDTGIAYHKDLNVKGGVSFCEGNADFRSDRFGHGTRCAGIAAGRKGGIAKDADLFSIKVTDTKEAHPVAILAGMGWALRNRMNVVSISLSGSSDLTYIPPFANAVQALMEINCLVVASTGESRDGGSGGDVGFPANTPGVIAVGGCDQNNVLLNGTRIGGKGTHLTIVAPGQDIKTTIHAGDGYVQGFSGSSAATPHVAGLIALIQQKIPGIAPLQVLARVLTSARPMNTGPNQRNVLGGTMLVNCDDALSV